MAVFLALAVLGWGLAAPSGVPAKLYAKSPAAVTPEYRVQLDVFTGPLDLLLYLIRRDELNPPKLNS